MSTDIQIRHDSLSNWNIADCIMKVGEMGVDTTNWRVRIGDGVSKWSELEPFLNALNANHHELEEKVTNVDEDEYVIWDSVSETYLKQSRRVLLENDSITIKATINDLKGITTAITNNRLFYCVATNAIYKYLVSDDTLTGDDKYIINGMAVDSKFVAVGGNLVYTGMDVSFSVKVNGTKVLGSQMVAMPSVTVTTGETSTSSYTANEELMLTHLKSDVTALTNKVNSLLGVLRTHGLISN